MTIRIRRAKLEDIKRKKLENLKLSCKYTQTAQEILYDRVDECNEDLSAEENLLIVCSWIPDCFLSKIALIEVEYEVTPQTYRTATIPVQCTLAATMALLRDEICKYTQRMPCSLMGPKGVMYTDQILSFTLPGKLIAANAIYED